MASKRFLALLVLAAHTVATPTIALPFNSQVPPVARVSEPFAFSFSPSTFSSSSTISYSLSNAPSWLSLDPGTRTLSGTPSEDDANTTPVIDIIATDDSGSTSMSATLVVRSNPAPVVNISLASQLESHGSYSPPSALLLYPSSDFDVTFELDTFSQNGSSDGLNYYAISADNTPLPSWIDFDGSSLSFTGTTPAVESLVEPPQTFGIQLTASDTLGFGGTYISFSLVIGSHVLAWTQSNTTINATGEAIDYTGLSDSLLLDGTTVASSNLTSITADTPDWLSFDNDTFALTGTPPDDATSSVIQIMAMDVYGDIANASVYISLSSSLFSDVIAPMNVTGGTPFSFDLNTTFTNASDVQSSVTMNPTSSWLSFDEETMVLSGQVPSSDQTSTIEITVHASSKSSDRSQSETFKLMVLPNVSSTTLSTATRSTKSSSTTTSGTTFSTYAAAVGHSSRKLSAGSIAAIVICTILAVIIIVCILFFCLRRRKNKRQSSAPSKDSISGPIVVTTLKGMRLSDQSSLASIDLNDMDVAILNSKDEKLALAMAEHPLKGTRRSHTFSGLTMYNSEMLSATPRGSLGTSDRTRSATETDLSRSKSWRTTQESAYPPIVTRSARASAAPNYSRRGSVKAQPNIPSWRNQANSDPSLRKPPSIPPPTIPWRLPPVVLEHGQEGKRRSKSSIQDTPDFAYDSAYIKSRKSHIENARAAADSNGRQIPRNPLSAHPHSRSQKEKLHHQLASVFPSATDLASIKKRSPGLGHGSLQSLPHLNMPPLLRGGGGVNRESNSWLTVLSDSEQGTGSATRRHSLVSSIVTASTNILNAMEGHRMSIRAVPKSPPATVPEGEENFNRVDQMYGYRYSASEDSNLTNSQKRPVSRRAPGSAGFFGGPATKAKSPRRSTRSASSAKESSISSTHDPLPPLRSSVGQPGNTNNALASSIMQSLRSIPLSSSSNAEPMPQLPTNSGADQAPVSPREGTRDAFGISYGSTYEGTRQLQSYVSGYRESMDSNGDSVSVGRFDSASESTHVDDEHDAFRALDMDLGLAELGDISNAEQHPVAEDEQELINRGVRRTLLNLYQSPLYFRDDEGRIVEGASMRRGSQAEPQVESDSRRRSQDLLSRLGRRSGIEEGTDEGTDTGNRHSSLMNEMSRQSSPTIEARLRPGVGRRPMSYDSSMKHQRSQQAVNVEPGLIEHEGGIPRDDSAPAFI